MKRLQTLRITLTPLALLGCLLVSATAFSGEYSDTLSDCLLDSATEADKRNLVRWVYMAVAFHPALEDIGEVSLSAREQVNREMADLLVDFLSVRCVGESRAALRHEGTEALQTSFSVLGQIAALNLFGDAQVNAALGSLETYISAEDLQRRLDIGQ